MSKEFNEEKVQRDPMEEERFRDFLQDQMKKDAQQIEAELREHPELAGLRPDDSAKDRLFGKIEDYERQKAIRHLSKEDREALELGRKVQREQADRRKKRRWKPLAAALAVILIAGTVTVTGVGGPDRVMEAMQQMVGGREMTTVNSDDKKVLEFENEKEEDAYQEIKDVFGIDPVRVVAHQLKIEFDQMEMDQGMRTATIFYEYQGQIISYIINCAYEDETWGFDIEDGAIQEYIYPLDETKVQVIRYKIQETGEPVYTANFDYQDVHYQLTGVMEKEDLEEILDNLHFL